MLSQDISVVVKITNKGTYSYRTMYPLMSAQFDKYLNHLCLSVFFCSNGFNDFRPLLFILFIPTHPSNLPHKYFCIPDPDTMADIS